MIISNKRGNYFAVLLVSIVLLSTLAIYTSNNSNIFISSFNVFDSKSDLQVIENTLNNVFYVSIGTILSNGFNNETQLWFENGPYSPNIDEFIDGLYILTKNKLGKELNYLANISTYNIDFSNVSLEYEFDKDEKKLKYYVSNIFILLNESNIFIKDELKFEYDFSHYLYAYEKLKNWNNIEGVLLFNEISDSFSGNCGSSCVCEESVDIPTIETGLDEEFIRNKIDEYFSKIQSDYFYDTNFECEYIINYLDTNDNFGYQISYGGKDSFCRYVY
jgi:hypothetical protein